jgi:hypothetical protein
MHASMTTMLPTSGGVRYVNGVEPRPLNATMTQLASGAQYINAGNQYLHLQQVGGDGENTPRPTTAMGRVPATQYHLLLSS